MELTNVKTNVKATSKKPNIVYLTAGLLLGIAPLARGIMPFGCAFLCAVPKRLRKSVFYGVLASSLFDSCIPLSLFCACYVFFVLCSREKTGRSTLYTRTLLALSVSALRVAYIAIAGVNNINDIFRLLTALISYPVFTYAFSGYFDKKKDIRPKRYDISLLAFAFSFTMLFSPFSVDGVSFAIIPACAFTLGFARTRGFAFGGICGIVCGLVSGGAVTGALGVMGICYGLLVTEIEALALVLSYMLATTGYFYLSGVDGFLPSALMMLGVYIVFVPIKEKFEIRRYSESSAEKRAHDRQISRYAAAFSSLSSLFYSVSGATKTESITELNGRIVNVVENQCAHCDGCELDKSEISNFFTSEIRRNGVATYSRIPNHISSICPNAYAIARSVNGLSSKREKEGEDKLKKFADECSVFSSLLIDAAKKQENLSKNDKALAEDIKNSLVEIGVECDGVRVIGLRLREIIVYGVKPDKITQSPEKIVSAVENVTKTSVSNPEFVLNDGYVLMKFKTVPAFRIECAKLSEAKNGESVCGDTVSVFENDERYFYCLVSDGMGSGRDAALTSRLSAIMLEKLLSVGAEKESALKLLNKALLEKDEEIFATVDLLEIDRVLSKATLIKVGAAPTMVIRNGRSALLESRTPPVGIMKNVIADKKTFKLEKGDMIVMLSDGILQTGSESKLLPENGLPPMPSARALATKIFRESQRNGETADDMSVCVLRIY